VLGVGDMNNKGKLKSFFKILFGSAGGQIILLCSLPFLSRFYGPSQFADYAIVLSITNILGVVISFRLENAIFGHTGLRRRLVFTLAGVMAIASAFAITVAVTVLSILFSFSSTIIIWGIVGALGFSLYNTTCLMLNAGYQYNEIAVLRISRPVVEVVVALGVMAFSSSYFLAIPISYALVLLMCLMFLSVYKSLLFRGAALMMALKRNRDCVLFDTPASLCVAFSSYAPFLILSLAFDKALLGMYSLAFRVVVGPVNTILQSVAYLSRQDLSEGHRQKQLMHSFAQWRSKLVLLGLIILIPVVLACYFDLFGLMFGAGWEGVDELVLVLTPLIVTKIIAVPLSFVFVIKKKLKLNLAIQLIGLGLTTMVLLGALLGGVDFIGTLIAYSLSYALFYFVYYKMSESITIHEK